MRAGRATVGFVVCAFPMFVGCATPDATGTAAQLTAGRSLEPDIPVPAGFELVERSSEDLSTGRGRLYLRHDYEGAADKFAIRTFYREQMPICRWRLIDDAHVAGDLTLQFEKKTERCTVRITDRKGWFERRARVRVTVSRRERADDPPPKRKGA